MEHKSLKALQYLCYEIESEFLRKVSSEVVDKDGKGVNDFTKFPEYHDTVAIEEKYWNFISRVMDRYFDDNFNELFFECESVEEQEKYVSELANCIAILDRLRKQNDWEDSLLRPQKHFVSAFQKTVEFCKPFKDKINIVTVFWHCFHRLNLLDEKKYKGEQSMDEVYPIVISPLKNSEYQWSEKDKGTLLELAVVLSQTDYFKIPVARNSEDKENVFIRDFCQFFGIEIPNIAQQKSAVLTRKKPLLYIHDVLNRYEDKVTKMRDRK